MRVWRGCGAAIRLAAPPSARTVREVAAAVRAGADMMAMEVVDRRLGLGIGEGGGCGKWTSTL